MLKKGLNKDSSKFLTVVVDETSVTREKRKPLIQLSQKYGYSVVAIVINTGKETCLQRAVETNQGDLIPVIEEMSSSYEDVSAEEGFDEIIRTGL
ncbi:MAG: AAA family ATPase [Bacillota bacterium]